MMASRPSPQAHPGDTASVLGNERLTAQAGILLIVGMLVRVVAVMIIRPPRWR